MVHGFITEEDPSESIRPCPIPPRPSKKRSDSNTQTDSLKLTGLRKKGWTQLLSPQFGGCCGIIGIVILLLSYCIAYLSCGNFLIHPFQPFSLAHLLHGIGVGFLIIFSYQVFRVQKQHQSLLGMVAGALGILFSCAMLFNAFIPRDWQITLVVHRLTWLLTFAFPALLSHAFSPVLYYFDKKSGSVYLLALAMSIIISCSALYVMAHGFFFLTLIQNTFLMMPFVSFFILFSVLLIIQGKHLSSIELRMSIS